MKGYATYTEDVTRWIGKDLDEIECFIIGRFYRNGAIHVANRQYFCCKSQ